MCGRYTQTKAKEVFVMLDETLQMELTPRYNVAPTQTMPVIVAEAGKPVLRQMEWGLIPHWSAEPKSSFTTINARAEDLSEKPTWKPLIEQHRCLVPADGYYEWTGPKTARLPWRVSRNDANLFYFAGLWSRWQKGDAPPVDSFTIVTTAADDFTLPIHTRMPVIVQPDGYKTWLTTTDWEWADDYLVPYSEGLKLERVNPIVNNARNETPLCIEVVPA